eukprot:m.191573 g.191573  ORF g.191573 m.191573 type:complete len:72 (+) comp18595_c0_seq2:305-520(+)
MHRGRALHNVRAIDVSAVNAWFGVLYRVRPMQMAQIAFLRVPTPNLAQWFFNAPVAALSGCHEKESSPCNT